jgi:hypothetical protein
MRTTGYLPILIILLLSAACSREEGREGAVRPVDVRYSSVVARLYDHGEVERWLRRPGALALQAHVCFPRDLAADVIFGVAGELAEGTAAPIRLSGSIWSARLGLTRDGRLWLAYGESVPQHGAPSEAANWETIDLGAALRPDTWYRLRVEADYERRMFLSFQIQGPQLQRSIDLRTYALDYPFNLPFDRRHVAFSVFALRNPAMEAPASGSARVFFDDVQGELEQDDRYRIVFRDGFEEQQNFLNFSPAGRVSDLRPGRWYPENEEVIVDLTREQALTGAWSCMCDAGLKGKE